MKQLFSLLCCWIILLSGCAQHIPVKQELVDNHLDQKELDQPTATDSSFLEPDRLISDFPQINMAQIGRYSVVSTTPTDAQTQILSVIVTITMPKLIQTVGEAIQHLLKPSGYQLARFDVQSPELIQLLGLPLPEVHRHLGPMSLHDALLTLVTPAFKLSVDPVHRLIAYDLKPDYKHE